MAGERVQRRLAAILAADVVGYSAMMREDETGTLARLMALRAELLDPKVEEFGGRIVKTMGDGVLVEFPSAVDAVQHAIDVQSAMRGRNAKAPADRRIEIRIGINLGDVIVEGDDLYGDGVNIAARLEELAEPGGIWLSDVVHGSVRNKLNVAFEDLGQQAVKNIAEPLHVYRVAPDAGAAAHEAAASAMFRRPAVAVLPFENLSGDPEQEYFADGLTEDIITTLSLWKSFPVIARNSTFAYKGRSPDVRKVGEELGARYVIEGSVRRAGNRVRVTAQLINAENGHHVWAERYDRDLEDIFELQDELTRRVVATVTPEVERAEHKRIAGNKPPDRDAWELVQQGFAHLYQFTGAGNAEARDLFLRAIELDPSYSRAHAGLAYSYHRDLTFQYFTTGETRASLAAECSGAARRAVDLDQSDSLAHMLLGMAYVWTEEFDGAVSEQQKAVELNPSNALAYVGLGEHLTIAGRPDEGIGFIETGLQLNPNDPRNHMYLCFMAHAHFVGRRYEETAEWARKAIERRPDFPPAYLILAASLGHLGRSGEARAALATCDRVHPGFLVKGRGFLKHKLKEDEDHFLDGLRMAGLPE